MDGRTNLQTRTRSLQHTAPSIFQHTGSGSHGSKLHSIIELKTDWHILFEYYWGRDGEPPALMPSLLATGHGTLHWYIRINIWNPPLTLQCRKLLTQDAFYFGINLRAVNTVIGVHDGRKRNGGTFVGRKKNEMLLYSNSVQSSTGVPTASHSDCTGGCEHGGKAAGAWCWLLTSIWG